MGKDQNTSFSLPRFSKRNGLASTANLAYPLIHITTTPSPLRIRKLVARSAIAPPHHAASCTAFETVMHANNKDASDSEGDEDHARDETEQKGRGVKIFHEDWGRDLMEGYTAT